jgi:hypothetical protein
MRYVLLLSVLFVAASVRAQVLTVPASTNEGASVTITYREAPDATFISEQVRIDFGDGTVVTNSATGRTALLNVPHTYADDSHFTNYTVTVIEDDFELGEVETTGQIRVLNVPPTGFLASEFYVQTGRLNGLVPVNDPGRDELTAQVSYGDGSIQDFNLGSGPGNKSLALIHTYYAIGNYTVSVTVRDDEGGVWSDTGVALVTGTPPPPTLSIRSFAGVLLTGEVGQTYDIQKADSAESTNWSTVATLTLTNNPQLWMDMDSTNSMKRFYRGIAR